MTPPVLTPFHKPVVAVLTRVALATLDELTQRGLETNDTFRFWLDATLRWAHDEEGPGQIIPYTRQLFALDVAAESAPFRHLHALCEHLRAVRKKSPWSAPHYENALARATLVLVCGKVDLLVPAAARVLAWNECFGEDERKRRRLVKSPAFFGSATPR